ncbi:MAG: aldo/keto reductase, partial [Anaerolineae bacterium]|nr:aldo/keto reductase [Anaerolineae bacterium]
IRMLHYAIDHGVNYVDNAYSYHRGNSEAFVGRALQGGYRERVKLATKLPSWLVKAPKDLNRYLNEQLERLQTETIDFYLLHSLNEQHWPKLRDLNVFNWAEKAMADGRIGYLGFSFHDRYEVFQEIVDAYDHWTFCQIQYNYMDEEHQAGTRGLKYAADRGLAVVVMEPIRGGQLARNPPRAIMELWDTAARKRTPADWALQWVWNHPEVSLVLSGMSTLKQVKQNVASASQSGPGTLTADELALIARVRDKYRELCPVHCTQCKYCLPCPSGVNIPRVLEIYNGAIMYNDHRRARGFYNWLKEEERADSCTQCAQCEELCPQEIEIVEWLAKIHQLLDESQNQ